MQHVHVHGGRNGQYFTLCVFAIADKIMIMFLLALQEAAFQHLLVV